METDIKDFAACALYSNNTNDIAASDLLFSDFFDSLCTLILETPMIRLGLTVWETPQTQA